MGKSESEQREKDIGNGGKEEKTVNKLPMEWVSAVCRVQDIY